MPQENTATFKYGYSLRLEKVTAALIIILYGPLAFFLALIHPFLSMFHWLIALGLFATIITCLSVAVGRFFNHRRQLDSKVSRARAMVIAGLCLLLVVGFFTPPHWWTSQTAGLWVHYKLSADVNELRTFGRTRQIPPGQDYIEFTLKTMPEPLRKYRPLHAFVYGGPGHRTVSVSWGGGMIGGWGLAVTEPNAPREQANPEMYINPDEYPRTEYFYIAPGAYVFFHEG